MQAILLKMNQEESHEKNEQDRRYRGSQDDIKIMRHELNTLSGSVGELSNDVKDLITALKGNEFGTEGIIFEIRKVQSDQIAIQKKFEDIETKVRLIDAKARANNRLLMGFVALVASGITALGKYLIDHLFKK